LRQAAFFVAAPFMRAPDCGIHPASKEAAMPEVIVHAIEGRSKDAKRALLKDITDAVVKHFGVPAENVVVQIVESSAESKSRGGIPFSERT
jgi:4-oxalocrotonate tautomerase